jgi:poly-gamma-glutamate synthesis protein (capsule biosynthesis protein)
VAFVRIVRERQADYDYLIVLLHGSDEFLVPTPRIQDMCRFMVEMGANAVLVQHPHCLGGLEHYRGGHIVYGQGALVMDEEIYRNLHSFHEGFLVRLNIENGAPASLEIIPFIQSSPPPGARRMEAAAERAFRLKLDERSRALLDEGWVEKQWRLFCERKKHAYVSSLLGHNRVLARLNTSGLVEKLLYDRQAVLRAKNVVCCETHREAIQSIFDGVS